MKKIVIIGTAAKSIHGFRSDMIKALVNNGYEVYAFFSESEPQDIIKIKKLDAIPVKHNLSRGGLNPVSDIKALCDLFIKIKKINPDIVFSFASKAIIFGTMASKLAGVPKVTGMLEGLGYTFTEQPNGLNVKTKAIKLVQIALYKAALPLLDNIIFLNPDDPKDLLEKYKINVKNVDILGGIGVDLMEYHFQEPKSHKTTINFLFIGRLLKEKGIFEFVNAARVIKEKYPDTCFTVLGAIDSANPGALTQKELNELVETNIINYPGYVDNIKDWIANSHIFVLPSYREGVPRSTQEAMAIGRAIITTDAPGCRDTVVNGVNGFLVPKWDFQALAQKMQYFIENPEQIDIMGKASYKIAQETYDAIKVNQKLLNIIG